MNIAEQSDYIAAVATAITRKHAGRIIHNLLLHPEGMSIDSIFLDGDTRNRSHYINKMREDGVVQTRAGVWRLVEPLLADRVHMLDDKDVPPLKRPKFVFHMLNMYRASSLGNRFTQKNLNNYCPPRFRLVESDKRNFAKNGKHLMLRPEPGWWGITPHAVEVCKILTGETYIPMEMRSKNLTTTDAANTKTV